MSETAVALPIAEQMVQKFQCPGCMIGSNVECGKFRIFDHGDGGKWCDGWYPGTIFAGSGAVALGLPKGFNRLGTLHFALREAKGPLNERPCCVIRLFERDKYQTILDQPTDSNVGRDKLNVPIWAMEGQGEDAGYLFVRVFAPRVGWHWIDVVKDGTLDMVPNAIDVGEFIDEID